MVLTTGAAIAQDAVPWARSFEEAQQIARQRQQLILLHFYGDNCPPCKALDANVFPRPEFARGLTANYVPVKINGSQDRQMAARYGVDRWPTDVVVTADGTPITRPTVSPQDPVKFLANLDQIAAMHRVRMSPEQQVTQNVAYNQSVSNSRYPGQPEAAGPAPVNNDAQRDPRLASGPVQPQQNMYDPQGYQPQQQAGGFDRRSSFQPAQAGQAYVGGSPYSPPPSDLPPRDPYDRGQAAEMNAQAPIGDNVRGMQSQTSDALYSGRPDAYAPRDVRLSQSHLTAEQNAPMAQSPLAAGRPQMQANPMVGPPSGAQHDVRLQANAPPANPPMGLEGYCPVTLIESMKWTKGDVRFGAIHRGRTYLFATQAEQQRFMANPDKFSPMLSGFDPIKYVEEGKLVDGNRKWGCVHEGHMYLFADEAALTRFEQSPRERQQQMAGAVQQAMQQSVTPRTFR